MGNKALRRWSIGTESLSAYGTLVAATRYFYPGSGSLLEREVEFHTPDLDMGSYDEGRQGRHQQLVQASGNISDMPLDTNMIIELLRMGVGFTTSANVTAIGTAGNTWTIPAGNQLNSMSMEFDASGQIWNATGCMADELSISWGVNEPVNVSASVIAKEVAKGSITATGTLDDYALRPIQGWEVQLYIAPKNTDPFTITAGATAATLIGGEVSFNNNLQRRYFDDNTQQLSRISRGRRRSEARLTMDLNSNAVAEYDNWAAGTERTIGLRFGGNVPIGTAGETHQVDVTLPGIWTAQVLGDDDEASTIELTHESAYGGTAVETFQVVVNNTRAT